MECQQLVEKGVGPPSHGADPFCKLVSGTTDRAEETLTLVQPLIFC